MCEGYHEAGDDSAAYSDLDELLCEYVDGTMDPTVRKVFEEYLCANPELRAHVERLCNARELLCHYRCQVHAPQTLQTRLHRRLGCEMMRVPSAWASAAVSRLGTAVMLSSATMLMVVLGMMAGGHLTPRAQAGPAAPAAEVAATLVLASPTLGWTAAVPPVARPLGAMPAAVRNLAQPADTARPALTAAALQRFRAHP